MDGAAPGADSGLIPARLEVEGPGAETELPFAALGDWPVRGGAPGAAGLGSGPRLGNGGGARERAAGAAAGLWQGLRPHIESLQRRGLALLQLLTCNMMLYFYEHLSPRNVIFLIMSGGVFNTAWVSLDPSVAGWALGLLYLFTASSRAGALEPLWSAALALAAQSAFSLAPPQARTALWYVLGGLAGVSELCWWPSVEYLIEANFHSWIVHFSTYYVVVIDFWVWPQLLQVDPSRWHITEEIQKAPTETQDAIRNAGVGLAVLVLLPLLACSLMAAIIIWRQNRRLCLMIGGVYVSAVTLLLLYRNVTPQQVISAGQIPIAVIFVVLGREQLSNVFGDTLAWKCQAALLVGLLVLRHLVTANLPARDADRAQAVGLLLFQLACKHWLIAQCSATRQGLSSVLRLAAWAPRRSGLLFGREEAHDPRLVLVR
mmetsp:Transcript_8566/g.25164  ORF Transcript_8566/g.25164 Transcript_8566/m.25164 type:complete len:431 (-) Transcript_8566:20-1312(-)